MDINWQLLKSINKSKFINTMYIWIFLVPILARLLDKVDDIACITIFNYTFEAQLTLPFSWITFYFSAIAFAIANLIFLLRCPTIIKDNNNYSDFGKSNKGVEHISEYLKQIDLTWDNLEKNIEENHDDNQPPNPKQDDALLRKRFWTTYDISNLFRGVSRFLTAFFYIIGFGLIAKVLWDNIIFVIEKII